MSNRIPSLSKILPADDVPEFQRWTPGQLPAPSEQTKLRPRSLKDLTESMLDKIVEAALEDTHLKEMDRLEQEDSTDAPLSLIPSEILEQAKLEAYDFGLEQGRTEGHKQGYELGHNQGYQQGTEEALAQINQLKQLTENVKQTVEQFEETLAPKLLSLAVSISEQILKREITLPSDGILRVINDAFRDMVGSEEQKRLHLNPDDIELVRKHLGESLDLSAWHIMSDDTVTRGGCMIHTKESLIDASVETAWQRVMDSLGINHPIHIEHEGQSDTVASPKKTVTKPRKKKLSSSTVVSDDEA